MSCNLRGSSTVGARRALEQVGGSGGVAAGVSALAGSREYVAARAARRTPARRRAQLGDPAVRLLEVVADDLLELVAPPVEPVGEALVEVGAPSFGIRAYAASRISTWRKRKVSAIAAWGGSARSGRAPRAVRRTGGARPARARRAPPRTPGRSRTPLEHVALLVGQRVEPRREKRLDRRRHVARSPPSASIASSCSTNSGLPSAPRGSARASQSSSGGPPSRFSISSSASAPRAARASSPRRPTPGRSSRSSGRARQRSSTGRPASSRRGARRDRAGSAPPSGCPRSRVERPLPGALLERLADRPEDLLRRVDRSAASSSSSAPASRKISIRGQYVMPSPYGRHRPVRTAASPASAADISRRAATCRSRRPEDRHEPALRVDTARRMPRAGGRAPRAARRAERRAAARRRRPLDDGEQRYAARGSALPLSDSPRLARPRPRPRERVRRSPIRISPGSAACSSRAATLTASPVTRRSAVPVTTSPVLTPVRAQRTPCRARAPRSARRAPRASRRRPAARAGHRPRGARAPRRRPSPRRR